MKNKPSTSQRSLKQSTLFEFSSPPKAGSSIMTEQPSGKASKRKQVSNPSPRRSTQSKLPITPGSSKKLPDKAYNLSDSEDSSENIGRIKLQKKESTESSSSSDSSDRSSDSDEVPRPTQARRLEKLAAFVDGDEEEDEGEDAPKKPSTRSSIKRRKTRAAKSSSEESEEEAVPKRRRLTRARKAPVANGAGSEDEDIDDLDQEYVLATRLRERGKKSEFQRNLEKLRKRKLKQEISSSNEDEESGEESEPAVKPFKGAKQADSSNGSLFGSNDEDDEQSESDFIVEDDGQVQLPAQFSMETHQDLQHQFKKIFQFFVHIAVQEPEDRKQFMEENLKNQEYFSVPLQITRRKFNGLRDSLVASSVWRPEFRKALERYPEFNLVQLDFAVNGCDACHLGSRISTLSGRLEGIPYDRMGFQPLKNNEKKKEQKKGKKRKKASYDSDLSESNLKKEFDLGRFCARRTQVYHEFSHWEYELFSGIEQELKDVRAQRAKKKNKQFYRVAYAGGKQPPEDLDDADALTDWLDERGIIEREWQRIRLIMDSARKLEMDGKKGGDLDTS